MDLSSGLEITDMSSAINGFISILRLFKKLDIKSDRFVSADDEVFLVGGMKLECEDWLEATLAKVRGGAVGETVLACSDGWLSFTRLDLRLECLLSKIILLLFELDFLRYCRSLYTE